MLIKKEQITGRMTHLLTVLHHQDGEKSYFEEYYPEEERPDGLQIRELFAVSFYRDSCGYYLIRVDEYGAAAHGLPLTKRAIRYFQEVFQKDVMEELGADQEVAIYVCWRNEMYYIRDHSGEQDLTEALASLPER